MPRITGKREASGADPTELLATLAARAVDVFVALRDLPGQTPAELCARLGMARSTASRTLTTLEEALLVYREIDGFVGVRRQPDHWYISPQSPARTVGADTFSGERR